MFKINTRKLNMFLILKLMLIILINSTYAYIQNSEIILLPTWNTTEAKQISLTFKVFGKLMQLNLHRNDQVVSSKFEIWKSNKKDAMEKLSKIRKSDFCFYLHEDHVSSAVINICQEHGLEGLLLVENHLLEIWPLQNVFAFSSFINNYCVKKQINQSIGKPHIIKRSLRHFPDSYFNDLHKIKSKQSYVDKILKRQRKFTIDLAVFVDAKAYNSMMKLLYFKIEKVLDVMLAYVNRIRALFCHPSLGTQIDISLVRLDFMETQPPNLPTYSNNKSRMLYSFCSYVRKLNPWSDNDLRHWDIGLYITGLTIVEYFIKILYYGTTYLGASIFTPCGPNYACAFVTLPSEKFENTYEFDQLARFEEVAEQSSVTAAHEIGHMLGLKDDSEEKCGENRPYIMCQGEKSYRGIEWSSLSQNVIKSKLKEHWCLFDGGKLQNISYDGHSWPIHAFDISTCYDYPGREQSAKAQCELFLNDKDANVVTLHDICKNLQCEAPRQNKSYFTGRPLNGTYCEFEKECCDGKCVPIIKPPYISIHEYGKEDNWSEWKEDSCKSSCLEKSRGTLAKRRVCEHLGQKTANCAGPYYDVILCNDSLLCIEKRKTIAEFTIKKCFEFVKNANMTELLIASGRQMIHDDQVPWVACTVFCRRNDTSGWYAPRQKMLDYGIDPYFPDGTWCHEKDRQHYYCRQHHCLPENYSFVEPEKCKNNCIKNY